MKLLIMFLFLNYSASATNYYVKNGGLDAANGLTNGTAWATTEKVNTTVTSGDSVFFNKGDTWHSKIVPASSNIYYGSYGTGNKPVITGFATLSGFTNIGNSWSATKLSGATNLNTVTVDGFIKAKGRYPNSTTLQGGAGTDSTVVITGVTLTDSLSWVGAEVAIGTYSWLIDKSVITSRSLYTLNVSPKFTQGASQGRFILQNLPSLCDDYGEWADSANKIYVYSTTSPTVQISTIDTLCYFSKKDYLTFDGLSFKGSNKIGVGFDSSLYTTVKNCDFTNNGQHAIQQSASKHTVLYNNAISNTLSDAIWTYNRSDSSKITNNTIQSTGLFFGMSSSGALMSMGMHSFGDIDTVMNNRIDSVGYNGIYFTGLRSVIKNNYVTNWCYTKSDGAAIYTTTLSDGSKVVSNICVGGLGGVAGNVNLSPGIYLDNSCTGVTIDSSTIDSCYLRALLLNLGTTNNTVKNNTVRNGIGHGMYFDDTRANTRVTNNVFYSTDSTNAVLFVNSLTAATTTIDSNWYLCPIKETTKLWRGVNNKYSLPEWVTYWTAYLFDIHSHNSPEGITSAAGTLHFNATSSASVVSFSGRKTDAKGNIYDGQVTLQPYQSVILFTATVQPTVTYHIGNFIFR